VSLQSQILLVRVRVHYAEAEQVALAWLVDYV
jgi:hypothetical protein